MSQGDIRLFEQRPPIVRSAASCMLSCPLLGREPCLETARHVISRCRDAFALQCVTSACRLCIVCTSEQRFCVQQGQGAFEGSLLPAKGEGKGKQKAVGKQSSKSRPAAEALSAGDDDQEDVLQDYELSDDSNMEE